MGLAGLANFANKHSSAVVERHLLPSESIQEVWMRLGQPDCLPIYVDASNVFFAIHQHTARTAFCVSPMTTRAPAYRARPEQPDLLSAQIAVQNSSAEAIVKSLETVRSSLAPRKLQAAARFILLLDNDLYIPAAKHRIWRARHQTEQQTRDRVFDTLQRAQQNAQVSINNLTSRSFSSCVDFPFLASFARLPGVSTVPESDFEQQYAADRLPPLLVVGALSEADLAFKRLYGLLDERAVLWTTDGDWALAVSQQHNSYMLRTTCTALDVHMPTSTGALWSVKQLLTDLDAPNMVARAWLRALVGDDYNQGLKGCGFKVAVDWGLHHIPHSAEASHLTSALAQMPEHYKTRNTWLAQVDTDFLALSNHCNFLLQHSTPVMSKISIRRSISMEIKEGLLATGLQLPFGPAITAPAQKKGLAASPPDLHQHQPKPVRQYLSRQPGRQQQSAVYASSAIDAAFELQPLLRVEAELFSSTVPETKFIPDDSTKSKKKRSRRSYKMQVPLTNVPTASARRAGEAEVYQETLREQYESMNQHDQAELAELRQALEEAADTQSGEDGGDGKDGKQGKEKKGADAYLRRNYWSPDSNVFRHFTAESAGLNTPGTQKSTSGRIRPDNTMDQVLQWAAFHTTLVLPTINYAASRYLKYLAQGPSGTRQKGSAKALRDGLRTLLQCLTTAESDIEASQVRELDENEPNNLQSLKNQCAAVRLGEAGDQPQEWYDALDLLSSRLQPCTILACASATEMRRRRYFPTSLSIEMVAAVSDTIEAGYPLITPAHLGMSTYCTQLSATTSRLIATRVANAPTMLVDHWIGQFVQQQDSSLPKSSRSLLQNVTLSWVLKCNLQDPEESLIAAVDQELNSAVQCLNISRTRRQQVRQAAVQAAGRVLDALRSLCSPHLTPSVSTYLALLGKRSKMDPCQLLPLVIEVHSLVHPGEPFILESSSAPAIVLSGHDMAHFVRMGTSVVETLERWGRHHLNLFPTALSMEQPQTLPLPDLQVPPGYKKAQSSNFLPVFYNILDPMSPTFALAAQAHRQMSRFFDCVWQRLGLATPVTQKDVQKLGYALIINVLCKTEGLKSSYIPTGRILIKSGSTCIECVDVRKPLQHVEDDVGPLKRLAQAAIVATAGSQGSAWIRRSDLTFLQANGSELTHYVNKHSPLHPNSAAGQRRRSVTVRQHAAFNTSTPASAVTMVPIVPVLPWRELLLVEEANETQTERTEPELEAQHTQEASQSQRQEGSDATSVESTLSVLEANGWLVFQPVAKTLKTHAKGWPYFTDVNFIALLKTLARSGLIELRDVREQIEALQKDQPLPDNIRQAVSLVLEKSTGLGVDLGAAVGLAAYVQTHSASEPGPVGQRLAFTDKSQKTIIAQSQRKSVWVLRTLPFDLATLRKVHPSYGVRRKAAETALAFSSLQANVQAQRRRQISTLRGRSVSQLLRAMGVQAVAPSQLSAAEGLASSLNPASHMTGYPVILVVGRDYGGPSSFASSLLNDLYCALIGRGFSVCGVVISEFCSSQRCCKPTCQRPREEDWVSPQTEEDWAHLHEARHDHQEGTRSEDDPPLVRSAVYTAVRASDDSVCYRVMQCECCRLVMHRDLQSAEIIWQSLVHGCSHLTHPFDPKL